MSESKKPIRRLKSIGLQVSQFWTEYEFKIVTISGLILVAIVAFEFGLLQGQKWQQKPLVIEKMAPQAVAAQERTSDTPDSQSLPQTPIKGTAQNPVESGKACQFVGSRNSNKYHLPTCQWAKRIKPENVVCFKSAEDAASRSYLPDKGCIK